VAYGGAFIFGGGNGSRAIADLSFARIALKVRMRSEVTIIPGDADGLFGESRGLFVGEVKVHDR
jgi:hypothetical protein